MKYLKKRRYQHEDEFVDHDPMAGIANLFDIGLVFIVALLISLFSVYRLQDLFDENANITIVKQAESGEMEIISKEGRKIKAVRMSPDKSEGRGVRLGTAYRLEDGSTIYVPQ